MDVSQKLDRLSELQAAPDAIRLQKQALIDGILTAEIRAKLAEIDAEFAPQLQAAEEAAASLEAEIRAEVATLEKRIAYLEEQTRKACHLVSLERGEDLANSYLAYWDNIHTTMDELAAALEWYADLMNYDVYGAPYEDEGDMLNDRGARARRALGRE